jgi:uncharacterized protein (TIGR03437 family)
VGACRYRDQGVWVADLAFRAPTISALVSSASYRETRASLGALLTIVGQNLASSSAAFQGNSYPITLAGTEVLDAAGRPMEVLYVSATQLNFRVSSARESDARQFRVRRSGVSSEPRASEVGVAPEIFLVGYDCFVQQPCSFSLTPAPSRPVMRGALTTSTIT